MSLRRAPFGEQCNGRFLSLGHTGEKGENIVGAQNSINDISVKKIMSAEALEKSRTRMVSRVCGLRVSSVLR